MSEADGFRINRNPNGLAAMVVINDVGPSSNNVRNVVRAKSRHVTIVSYSSRHKESSYHTSHHVTSVR